MPSPLALSCTDYASFKAAIAKYSPEPQFVEVFYIDTGAPVAAGGIHSFAASAFDYKQRISYVLQPLLATTDPMPTTFLADFPGAVNNTSGAVQNYTL